MKFKLDKNLPVEAAEVFRAAGHEAATVHEQQLSGATDQEVMYVCRREQRALITLDMDFANVTAYPPKQFSGILVLRLRSQSTQSVSGALRRVVPLLAETKLIGALWIVEEDRVRIRSENPD